MAEALWVKTIRNHRTDRQATVPCRRDDPHEALREAYPEADFPEAEIALERELPEPEPEPSGWQKLLQKLPFFS